MHDLVGQAKFSVGNRNPTIQNFVLFSLVRTFTNKTKKKRKQTDQNIELLRILKEGQAFKVPAKAVARQCQYHLVQVQTGQSKKEIQESPIESLSKYFIFPAAYGRRGRVRRAADYATVAAIGSKQRRGMKLN